MCIYTLPRGRTHNPEISRITGDKIFVNTCFAQAVSYLEFKDQCANNVDPDEVAHEPPHQDLCCLLTLLFSLLGLQVLKGFTKAGIKGFLSLISF